MTELQKLEQKVADIQTATDKILLSIGFTVIAVGYFTLRMFR